MSPSSPSSASAEYIVQTLATLAAVCALAVAVLWAARRAGVGRPSGPLELLGRLPLEARRSIYLVKVGEVVFVIGVGEAGMTKLGEVQASGLAQVPPTQGAYGSFGEVLSRALKGKKGKEGV